MNIGLTGATGLIGKALSQKLNADGHSVIAFTRNPDHYADPSNEARLLDLRSEVDVSDLDVIIHLAGEPIFGFWTKAKKKRLRESRIDLSRHLVDAIRNAKAKPTALIAASGVSYYGDGGDQVLEESAPKGEGFLSDLAADWEAEVSRASEKGLRVARLRFGAVLAQDGGMLPLVRKVFRLCLGGRLAGGNQWMSWVHLDDVVSLIRESVSNPGYEGAVNVTAPSPVTNREFTKALASAVGRPAIFPAPAFALKMVLRGLSEVALQSQRCQPAVAMGQKFDFAFRDIRSALDDLLENGRSR